MVGRSHTNGVGKADVAVASRNGATVALDAQTRTAIREGREQARKGEFVSDKDIGTFFRRHGITRYQA